MNNKYFIGGIVIIAIITIANIFLEESERSEGKYSIRDSSKQFEREQTCINGVVYYDSYHQLAPKYNRDQKVELCE